MANYKTNYPLGCYADGAFGHDHVRRVLKDLVEETGGSEDLVNSLQGAMPDDAWDEYEALDWLNEHAASEGCAWEFNCGDLIYTDDEA